MPPDDTSQPFDPKSLAYMLSVGATSQPNVPAPRTTDMPPPDLGTGTPGVGSQPQPLPQAQTPQGAQGLPKPGGMPALVGFFQQVFGGQNQRGYGPSTATSPGRPVSRLDSFENFVGNFLNSFAQGMQNSGTGPGAFGRGMGAAMQAPYQQQLQQYQMGQQQQMQQSEIQGQQARTQLTGAQTEQSQLETELAKRRLEMMKGGGAGLDDPIKALGTLSPDEQAVLGSAKYESAIKGDQTPLLQAVEKITNMRAISGRQQTGIKAADARTQKSLDEKVREFQITDTYRKWKANLDNATRMRIASMNQTKAPAAMMQTAVFSKGGLERMDSAERAMQELEKSGVMGSLPANTIENWIFGRGSVDPRLDSKTRETIGRLRAALGYTSSAAMRAHTGRTSQEIYQDFKDRLGAGQDWSALRGAIAETRDMLSDYASSASDANIQAIREGKNLQQGGAANPIKPAGNNTGPLTADEAQEYLRKAGGNKDVARKMAKADKRTF